MKRILLTAGVFVSTFASVFAQKAPIVLYKDGANALQLNYSTFTKFGEDSTSPAFEGTKQYKIDYTSADWWGGNVEFKFASDLKDFSGYTYLEVAWKAEGGTHTDGLLVNLSDSSKAGVGPRIQVGTVGDEIGNYSVSRIPLSALKGSTGLNLSLIKFLGFAVQGGSETAAGTFYIDNISIVDDPTFVVDNSKIIYKGNTNISTVSYSKDGLSIKSVTTGAPFEGSKHYELSSTAADKSQYGGVGGFNIDGWGWGQVQDYSDYKYLALAFKGTATSPATLSITFKDTTGTTGQKFKVATTSASTADYNGLLYFPLLDSIKGSTNLNLKFIEGFDFLVEFKDPASSGTLYLDNIIITKEKLTIGVDDVEYFSNLSVSPNPSNGIFNISSDRSIHTLVVTDYMGTVINAPLLNGNSIDLSNQKAGMYLVRISSGDQKITKKLIKE
jgi:hypothetical protein